MSRGDVRAALERALGPRAIETRESPLLRGLPVAVPASEAALVETLRFAQREKLALVPIGFGSKLGWCRPPDHADFALSTRGLAGAVAYEPADGTLTALAGSTLAELEAIAHAGGNHLTPLAPRPSTSTLGGVLAAGQSGLDRTRVGPVRNHVLGMRVVLADGSSAKTGGRLVKNVTGYDLHRLYCGSHGTLCVIVEATLRLFAAPETTVVVRVESALLADAFATVGALARTAVRPLGVRLECDTDATRPCVASFVLTGAREVVAWELDALHAIAPSAARFEGEGAASELARLRDLEVEADAWPHLHATTRPSQLAHSVEALLAAIGAHGLAARVAIEPSIATIDVHLRPRHVNSEVIAALVRELRSGGLSTSLRRGPTATSEAIDPFGEASPALEWMRRMKDALDPNGTFACGRFHGGI